MLNGHVYNKYAKIVINLEWFLIQSKMEQALENMDLKAFNKDK